jgi:hypothetical protein
MLISMPTDTSTILGVFQAILALLVKKPDEPLRCGTGADVDQASAAVFFAAQPFTWAFSLGLFVFRKLLRKHFSPDH